jgi:hypothetical protein
VESFDYLSVLLSVIIGLAITQVLLGFRRLILTRMKVKLYLPTVIWAGLTLLIAIQAWWANFGLRTRGNWTFLAFIVIVLQAISVYMATAVVLPDIAGTPLSICETTTSRIKAGSSVSCLEVPSSVQRKNSLSRGICLVD